MRYSPFATTNGIFLAVCLAFGFAHSNHPREGLGTYPEVIPLTAAADTIHAGESTTLTWTSRGAASLLLEGYTENGVRAEEQAGLPARGSITVQPRETTVYRMRCETGFDGGECAGADARVEVKKAPLQIIESGLGGN